MNVATKIGSFLISYFLFINTNTQEQYMMQIEGRMFKVYYEDYMIYIYSKVFIEALMKSSKIKICQNELPILIKSTIVNDCFTFILSSI